LAVSPDAAVPVLGAGVLCAACAKDKLAPTNMTLTNVNSFFMDAPSKGKVIELDNSNPLFEE
jgi:hypothetical protein